MNYSICIYSSSNNHTFFILPTSVITDYTTTPTEPATEDLPVSSYDSTYNYLTSAPTPTPTPTP